MTAEMSVIGVADPAALAALVGGANGLGWLAAAAALFDSGSEVWAATQAGRTRALVRFTPAIGLQPPRHWYHVGCVVHASPELRRRLPLATLQLNNDLTGEAELAGWLTEPGLDPHDCRAAWRALLAAGLQRLAGRLPAGTAAPRLLVELPGPRDDRGASPFWQGLGRHFYAGDPAAAQARFGDAWRSHVAALLPRQLVYCAFLPEAAQQAIGTVHGDAQALAALLHEAGLRWSRHIRIDDGGPVFVAEAPRAGMADPTA